MRKVTNYFRAVFWSMSDPAYYYQVLSRSIWFSVAFFSLTLILVSLSWSLVWHAVLFPRIVATASREAKQLIAGIPPSAVFRYADGRLQVDSVPLPLEVKSTAFLRDAGLGERALVVTAKEEQSNALVTLTPTAAYVSPLGDSATPLKYTELFASSSGSLKATDLPSFIDTIVGFIHAFALPIISAFFVATLISSFFSGILMILLFSLLLQSVGWFFGVRLRYRDTLVWGLHIYPLAVALNDVSALLVTESEFPLISVVYILMGLVIIWYGRSKQQKTVVK